MMNQALLRSWWLIALRGAIALMFGMLALVWPGMTLVALTVLFAAFALMGGALWTFAAVRYRASDEQWGLLLLLGVVSLVAGTIAALHPAMTLLVLIVLIGANALVSGAIDIFVAVRVRKLMRGEWLLVLSGIVSILFGALILLFPLGAGALALAWVIGFYALLTGALMLVLAYRVRSWSRLNGGRSSPSAGAL